MLKWNQSEKKKASSYQSSAKIFKTEHQYWPTGVRHLLCISIKKRSPKLLIVRRFWISFVQEEKLSKIPDYHCTVAFVSGLRHSGSCRTLVSGHLWYQNYGTSATLLALVWWCTVIKNIIKLWCTKGLPCRSSVLLWYVKDWVTNLYTFSAKNTDQCLQVIEKIISVQVKKKNKRIFQYFYKQMWKYTHFSMLK